MTLQCSICQTRLEWKPNPAEIASLKDQGASLVPCPACKKKTYFVYPSYGDFRPGVDRRASNRGPAPPRGRPVPVAGSVERPGTTHSSPGM